MNNMISIDDFNRNMIGNPLNCDRIDGQEFNILRYYHNGRLSKRGSYKFRRYRRGLKWLI